MEWVFLLVLFEAPLKLVEEGVAMAAEPRPAISYISCCCRTQGALSSTSKYAQAISHAGKYAGGLSNLLRTDQT